MTIFEILTGSEQLYVSMAYYIWENLYQNRQLKYSC